MTNDTHTTKAHYHANVPALIYNGEVIHERHEMLSLTDMWRAAKGDEQKAPAKWRALPTAKAFADHVALTVGKSTSELFITQNGGRNKGTWAHWHVAMAYAKYLDHDFHMWCNEVVRERMESRPLAIPSLDEAAVGGITKGVVRKAIGDLVPGLLAEALTLILPALVREQVAGHRHAVIEGISAGQVIAMAGIQQRKGLRGLSAWVSSRLRRFHAQRGVVVRLAALGSRTALIYDPLICREWLANGGKAEIERKIAERRGQGKLHLI